MQQGLVTVRPEDDVEKAVRTLVRRGVSGAPVVDREGRLRGVLSEHDCIRVLAQAIEGRWPEGRVEQHMTREVESVRPDEDLLAISARFTHGHHRRLLVVEGDRVIGLLSRRDLLRALEAFEGRLAPGRSRSTWDEIALRHQTLD